MSQSQKHAEFYRRLGELLEEYDVDIVATDDGEFNRPYRSDELTSLNQEQCNDLAEACEVTP